MDAITQALPIFVDPASALLPIEETDAAGGSLFGALVAAFAKEGEQQDEVPLRPAEAPLHEIVATNNAPPPILARQWIAQLASMPELPAGLDTVGQYRLDALPIDAQPTFAPGDEFPSTEGSAVGTAPQLGATRTLPAVGRSVSSAPSELVFVQTAPSSAKATSSDTDEPLQTHTEKSVLSAADVEPKAPPSAPTLPRSLAPATISDRESETQLVVPVEEFVAPPPSPANPQDNSIVGAPQENPQLRAFRPDKPDQKSRETGNDTSTVDPTITQFLAPLSIEEVVPPALSVNEISGDEGATIDTVAEGTRPAARNAPVTLNPRSAISPPSDAETASNATTPAPRQDPPQTHGLAVNAKSSTPAPTPPVNIAAANNAAVNFLLSQDEIATPAMPSQANGLAQTEKPKQPELISPAGANLQQPPPADFTSEQTALMQPVKPQTERPTRPASQQTARSLPAADTAAPSFAPQMPNAVQPPPPQTAPAHIAQALSFAPATASDPGSAGLAVAEAIPGLAPAPRDTDDLSIDALALRIAARSAGNDSRFTIRLDPPELGHIEVNLNVNAQGHAQAALVVEKPHTLELLQRDAATLERALRDAGLDLSTELSFSLKGDGASQFWRDEQSAPRSRNLEIAEAANANAALSGAAALAATYYGAGTARLDITV